MKNKIIKIFSIFLVITLLVNIIFQGTIYFGNLAYADAFDEGLNIQSVDNGNAIPVTQSIFATIIEIMRTVALGVAVIMLLYMAIKYITESPEGKASFKKSATLYIIGAVILFGTSGILTIIKKFADEI